MGIDDHPHTHPIHMAIPIHTAALLFSVYLALYCTIFVVNKRIILYNSMRDRHMCVDRPVYIFRFSLWLCKTLMHTVSLKATMLTYLHAMY